MLRFFRLGATLASYGVYALGSFLIWWMVYPLTVWAVTEAKRPIYARHLSRWAFRFFIEWMRWIRVWDYRIRGRNRLGCQGKLIVANHPSFLDVVLLLAWTKNAVCIVKPALVRLPLVGRPIQCCGHILADGDPQELVQMAAKVLAQGTNLILFPQGTRTLPEDGWHFHRSAARIALETRVPIVPVYFRYRPLLLGPGQYWYHIPRQRPVVTVEVGEEIRPWDVVNENLPLSLASRRLTRFLEQRFADWK